MNASIESIIFPPDSKPYGVSYEEWAVKWWRWLLSIPKARNPALDSSGVNSTCNQDDPNVWFLAGTFGGSAERKCKIPSEKAIFMPIINYECSFADAPTVTTEQELAAKCRNEIDDIRDLAFMLNELSLTDMFPYRMRSPPFTIHLVENNVLDVDAGPTQMVSDGYWIFLKPLTTGMFHIKSFASCRSGKIRIGTSYELLVE